MGRAPGLIKRKWKWKSKTGEGHCGWTYATRIRVGGEDHLFTYGTQLYGDALRQHRRVVEGFTEVRVEVAAQGLGTRWFTWRRSARAGEAAAAAARAYGRGGVFGLQRPGGEALDESRELRDMNVRDGDRLELVSRLTVDEAHALWRASDLAIRRTGRGPKEAAARYLRHVSPRIGAMRLDTLTGEDIRRLRVALDGTRVSGRTRVMRPETVRHVLSDLRCFLNWAADDLGGRLIATVPWPRAVLPRIKKRPPDRLFEEEIAALLQIGEPHAFVIRLGLATGLRWGDLCRTQASDLSRAAAGGWCLNVAVGKTGEVLRVPLTDQPLVGELTQRVGRLVPFSEKSATVFNRTVRRHSGVARFHVHQLRHTFACRYLEHGGSLAALQQILGHASVTTTERYARLLHTHVMQDAQRVNGTLNGDNNGENGAGSR